VVVLAELAVLVIMVTALLVAVQVAVRVAQEHHMVLVVAVAVDLEAVVVVDFYIHPVDHQAEMVVLVLAVLSGLFGLEIHANSQVHA
jgi:hypothetical protein